MKNLFMVNTPMQLMNAAIIAYATPESKFDAYCTSNIYEKAKRLESDKVFDNCYEINLLNERFDRNNAVGKAINRIGNALGLHKIINSLPSSPQDYATIFISGVGMRNIEYYYALKKINPKIQLSLYEEGLFEYVGFSYKSRAQELFSRIFFGRYYLNDASSLYIHDPNLVLCSWEKIKKVQISKDIPDDLLWKLNKAFDYSGTVFNACKKKCIIVEQEFYSDDTHSIKVQKQIIDMLGQLFGKDNVIIKLHPRSALDKYPEYTVIDSKAPLELIALNEKIEDNIFVSINSSAILNLPLMCDVRSNVYILNNLVNEGSMASEISQVVNKMNLEMIHLPSSIEEFRSQLFTEIANEEVSENIKDKKA